MTSWKPSESDVKWEKKAKKSGATWIRQEFKESCELVKNMISRAKADYYVNIINDCCGDQKKLFQIVDKLLGREKKIVLPDYSDAKSMAQIFNEFFVTKLLILEHCLLHWKIQLMLCFVHL